MMKPDPRCLLVLALLLAGCGGGDPAPDETAGSDGGDASVTAAETSEPAVPSDGADDASAAAREEGPSEPPPPAEPAPDAGTEPAAAPETKPEPAADAPPERLEDITDAEVLASWAADEREALMEMSEEERAEFMHDRRVEIFTSRGGKLLEESGKMGDQDLDPETGMRGPARPDAPRADEELAPPDLRDILADLASNDLETRARGAESAKRYPDQEVATRHLLKVLDDDNEELRAIVCSTLGALGRVEALEPLREVVRRDRKAGVRSMALRAIQDIGGAEGIALLRDIAAEGVEPSDRAAALGMLVDTKDVKNIRDLLPRALDDLTPEVRQQAAIAVRAFDLKTLAPEVEGLLEDFSDQVIIDALRTLGAINARSSVPAIMAVFLEPDPESEDPEAIQNAAAGALKAITGEDNNFSDTLPDDRRLAAIDAWRIWWEKNKADWK